MRHLDEYDDPCTCTQATGLPLTKEELRALTPGKRVLWSSGPAYHNGEIVIFVHVQTDGWVLVAIPPGREDAGERDTAEVSELWALYGASDHDLAEVN